MSHVTCKSPKKLTSKLQRKYLDTSKERQTMTCSSQAPDQAPYTRTLMQTREWTLTHDDPYPEFSIGLETRVSCGATSSSPRFPSQARRRNTKPSQTQVRIFFTFDAYCRSWAFQSNLLPLYCATISQVSSLWRIQ